MGPPRVDLACDTDAGTFNFEVSTFICRSSPRDVAKQPFWQIARFLSVHRLSFRGGSLGGWIPSGGARCVESGAGVTSNPREAVANRGR